MVSGPTRIPTGPRREIPPSTEKRIKNGEIFIFLLINIGLNKLSISPTKTTAHIKRPIAGIVCPVAKRKIIAGIETNAVPMEGIRDATAATIPQSAGFGTPNIPNPIPISKPCIKAINKYPFITPFTTWESLATIFLSSVSESGLKVINVFFHLSPSFKK